MPAVSERLHPEQRYDFPRRRYFWQLVDEQTRIDANLNVYGDPSTPIRTKYGTAQAFLGDVQNGMNVNIVVINEVRTGLDGEHSTWYLRTFPGEPIQDIKTEEEEEAYFRKVSETRSRKFRIPGAELSERIKEIIHESTTDSLAVRMPR